MYASAASAPAKVKIRPGSKGLPRNTHPPASPTYSPTYTNLLLQLQLQPDCPLRDSLLPLGSPVCKPSVALHQSFVPNARLLSPRAHPSSPPPVPPPTSDNPPSDNINNNTTINSPDLPTIEFAQVRPRIRSRPPPPDLQTLSPAQWRKCEDPGATASASPARLETPSATTRPSRAPSTPSASRPARLRTCWTT